MALLGEEVVEEWLNRNGYFTIRGIKLGVHEIDLLAFKPSGDGNHECRHIEVQMSVNPVAYISKVPMRIQKERGIGPDNAKTRTAEELEAGILEWVQKKFNHPKKLSLKRKLYNGAWTRELVVNRVRHPEELDIFQAQGIKIWQVEDIVKKMLEGSSVISSASGGDLLNLIQLGEEFSQDNGNFA